MTAAAIPPAELLPAYRAAAAERQALGVPPLPLSAPQTQALTALLAGPPAGGRCSYWSRSAWFRESIRPNMCNEDSLSVA
jgi:aconitase B